MVQTIQRNISVTPGQRERVENAADEHRISANHLLVDLTMETLDRHQ